MPNIDLNQLREQLKSRQNVGVNKNGQLINVDPHNDGLKNNSQGLTTLEPKRFFDY